MSWRMWLLLALCLLLCAACASGASQTEVTSDPTEGSAESDVSPSEPEESEEVPSVPEPEPYVTYGSLRFSTDGGWEVTDDEGLYAIGPDGTERAEMTPTDFTFTNNLTMELLLQEALPTLSAAWEEAGVTELSAEVSAVFFLDAETPAIVLRGFLDETELWQTQLYLQANGHLLLVTVTSHGEDHTEAILQRFTRVAE